MFAARLTRSQGWSAWFCMLDCCNVKSSISNFCFLHLRLRTRFEIPDEKICIVRKNKIRRSLWTMVVIACESPTVLVYVSRFSLSWPYPTSRDLRRITSARSLTLSHQPNPNFYWSSVCSLKRQKNQRIPSSTWLIGDYLYITLWVRY